MSLTGFQSVGPEAITKVEIPAANEWRFEVDLESKLLVRLIHGNAEIFGTELARGMEYEFTGQHAAIYTYKGCTIEHAGNVNEYLADTTPMTIFANLHFALEAQRSQAQSSLAASASGPRLLVVGPPNSGKSSLCKILVSYAVKMGRYPMLVNLDPKESVYSPPGGLVAAPISHILDIETGWGSSPASGPSPLHPKQPLVYYYGLNNIHKNPKHFRESTELLATGVKRRIAEDKHVRISGMIVDAPSALTDGSDSYESCEKVVNDFGITAIAVVGNERLYSELTRRFTGLTVVRLPKSGGVVDNDDTWNRKIQRLCLQQYFYGVPRQPLSPYTVTVRFNNLTVWRVLERGSGENYNDYLPGGGEDDEGTQTEEEVLTKIEPSAILQNCVLAIVNANPSDPADIVAKAEVLGYVHISEADETRHQAKVLLPVPGGLPSRPLILADWQYHE